MINKNQKSYNPTKVSVILPTYNEAENIKILIPQIYEALNGMSYEIIVVDDNSPDGTASVAKKLSKLYNVKVIVRKNKKGLATAVVDGIKHSVGDIIVVMDADMQHSPQDLIKILEKVLSDEYDIVVGTRYAYGGNAEGLNGIKRSLVSKCATLLAKMFIPEVRGLTDPMSGFFAFKRCVVADVLNNLNPLGYKIFLEILVKGHWSKICEVPIVLHKRAYGKSKLDVFQIVQYVMHLIKLKVSRK